jgi:phosphoglucomutase
MTIHPLAGKPAPPEILVDVARLVAAYYGEHPDPGVPAQRVSFGTSGHRGSSAEKSFNEDHILAVSQAICDLRKSLGADGPLFLGKDTHALSAPAFSTALEVLAGNGVEVMIQRGLGFTPVPVISHAILTYNRGRTRGLSDGVAVTPSHNPPEYGGFKYNPPQGGPADTTVTKAVEERANAILSGGLSDVRRTPYEKALRADSTSDHDYVSAYVSDLKNVIQIEAAASAKLRIGVDPLGGSSIDYWDPIAEAYGLDIEVVNRTIDPAFGFMTVDHDGKIRMDCSSPYAMARLVTLKDRFDVAFGNDPDCDRHGIVSPGGGLMNPNHYLSAAVWYLFQNRSSWSAEAGVGKTLVSSAMIDRVARHLGRRVCEVPVGFKWFVDGLLDGSTGFCGEESAGAAFLRKDGGVWTTDKDGILMNLLAVEITALTGGDPAVLYRGLEERFGSPAYARIDVPATRAEKEALKNVSPAQVTATELAGERILAKLSRAPGNDAPIGGLKVVAEHGWMAVRPSGTEDVYKIYAESFKGEAHLGEILDEARRIVASVIS